jgi:hypothetical protein
MPQRFGRAVITLACPECGTRNQHTADTLWGGRELSCSQCQSRLAVDVDQLNLAVAQMATAAQALMYRITDRSDGCTRVVIAH